MENKPNFKGWIWIISLCIWVITSASFAAAGPAENAVFYRLVEGTSFDDCVPCMRPTFLTAVDGGFSLIPDKPEMWYQVYQVRDFNFRSVGGYQDYAGRFQGWYKIGGDFAYDHRMHLEGEINGKKCVFEGQGFPQNSLPWIEIKLDQIVPAGDLSMFALYVVATPWPGELRFSTNIDFTSGNKPIGKVSDGDLLATSGRVVRRNFELTRRLGIMPMVPDLGLDAVTPAAYLPTAAIGPDSGAVGVPMPVCEIWFSIDQDIWSEKLGVWLHDGDVLSDSGRVVRSYADLIGAFGPMPPAPDVGLDALATDAKGQILFSVKQDFFSEKLGKWIGRGDLLSETGAIVKTNAELLAAFSPVDPAVKDFGLDAVLLLPRDEIWFSTETGFTDKNLGAISDGDLLSTKRRIVMKNLHLLREFAPMEKLANFGLDAVEFASRVPLGDYDADCSVQLDDFAALAVQWLSADCVECGGIDLTGDGVVDLNDLLIFAEDWLMGVAEPGLSYTIGPCGSAVPPAASADPRFAVSVQGRYIQFKDAIYGNCCDDTIELTMDVQGNEITVLETEYAERICRCMCTYPTTARLGPFAPGTYTLAVVQQDANGKRLIGTVKVVLD
jgi:hypothetical protein